MSEKVLGFKEKGTIFRNDLDSWLVRTDKLVPIVSVEWLKRWCKENTVLVDAKGNRAHVSRSKLYDAVSLQAVSK